MFFVLEPFLDFAQIGEGISFRQGVFFSSVARRFAFRRRDRSVSPRPPPIDRTDLLPIFHVEIRSSPVHPPRSFGRACAFSCLSSWFHPPGPPPQRLAGVVRASLSPVPSHVLVCGPSPLLPLTWRCGCEIVCLRVVRCHPRVCASWRSACAPHHDK